MSFTRLVLIFDEIGIRNNNILPGIKSTKESTVRYGKDKEDKFESFEGVEGTGQTFQAGKSILDFNTFAKIGIHPKSL